MNQTFRGGFPGPLLGHFATAFSKAPLGRRVLENFANGADIGIDVRRILHGEEEFEYIAPIYPGDVLTGTTTLVDGKTRQGSDNHTMDILTTETRYVNQDNQHVLTTRSTIIVRE